MPISSKGKIIRALVRKSVCRKLRDGKPGNWHRQPHRGDWHDYDDNRNCNNGNKTYIICIVDFLSKKSTILWLWIYWKYNYSIPYILDPKIQYTLPIGIATMCIQDGGIKIKNSWKLTYLAFSKGLRGVTNVFRLTVGTLWFTIPTT